MSNGALVTSCSCRLSHWRFTAMMAHMTCGRCWTLWRGAAWRGPCSFRLWRPPSRSDFGPVIAIKGSIGPDLPCLITAGRNTFRLGSADSIDLRTCRQQRIWTKQFSRAPRSRRCSSRWRCRCSSWPAPSGTASARRMVASWIAPASTWRRWCPGSDCLLPMRNVASCHVSFERHVRKPDILVTQLTFK